MRVPNDQMERLIAEARRQKQAIEEMVTDLEARARFEEDDVRYADGVLRRVEAGLRRIRRRAASPIRFL